MPEYKSRDELEEEDWERYRKRQEDIYQRRQAKFEAEGHKCKQDGCGLSFKSYDEFGQHLAWHQEETRKNMVCNQSKCGQKFNNRRAYNEHCEAHKVETRRKIMKTVRAVLMYNKHGLLLESFEREYRGMEGKPVPYKFLGFNSLYDLLVNSPDNVQVVQAGGQVLLLGVPDKETEHIAKMVGSQREGQGGFNRRTEEVIARLGGDIVKKIDKMAGRRTRVVPEFVRKQLEQLLSLDMFEDGIFFSNLFHIYEEEFGYSLEFKSDGFYNLEDFCFNGLDGLADIELVGGKWKLLPKSEANNILGSPPTDISDEIRNNIKSLIDSNPFGLSCKLFLEKYGSSYGRLDLLELGCRSVEELACLLPDCCQLHTVAGAETVVTGPGRTSPRHAVLAQVQNNLAALLAGHPGGVRLDQLASGYQGYHGSLDPCLAQLNCPDLGRLCQFHLSEVCRLEQRAGQVWVMPAQEETRPRSPPPPLQLPPTPALQPGSWVKVLVPPCLSRLTLHTEQGFRQLRSLEAEMEGYYSIAGNGRGLGEEQLQPGALLAALHTDLAWHRARLLGERQDGRLEVVYPDWGWRALLDRRAVRLLQPQFAELAGQAVQAGCTRVVLIAGLGWKAAMSRGNVWGRVTGGLGGQLGLQLYLECKPEPKPGINWELSNGLKRLILNTLVREEKKLNFV